MASGVNSALDVRLMRTLLILLTECSVSRTANILEQTQPTVSLALKRLRELIGDPLLVRSGASLVPTERGKELKLALPRLLDDLDSLLGPQSGFDPVTSDRHFRIIAANCLGAILVPRIVREISRRAPNASVDLGAMPQGEELLHRLADGSVDVVIGNWPNPPDYLRIAPLLSTDIVCLVRPSHPLAGLRGRLTMERYLRETHISPTSDELAGFSPIDGRLIELGERRRIAATVPEYAMVPYVLAQSDHVFTTGRPFAEHLAQIFPFATIDAPAEFGLMQFYMLWHERKHNAPAHEWLRQVLKGIALEMRELESASLAPSGLPGMARRRAHTG